MTSTLSVFDLVLSRIRGIQTEISLSCLASALRVKTPIGKLAAKSTKKQRTEFAARLFVPLGVSRGNSSFLPARFAL
jgi:hypothetical protein